MPARGLFVVLTLVLLTNPRVAFGHAVLTHSSLGSGGLRANTETAVTLTFNAAIETGFTRVVLVDAQKQERPLDVVRGKERAKVTVTIPPLLPGAYGLRYKVLAADGHVTESLLRFTVSDAE